jgi:hypothetical protein
VELNYLLVADCANLTNDGKLNVMGIFDTIHAQGFPCVHAQLFIVAELVAGPAEYGRTCLFEVKILDEDAAGEVLKIGGQMVVPRGMHGTAHIRNIVAAQAVTFPKPGTYEISILIDQDVKGIKALHVVPFPPMGATGPVN